MEPEFSKSSKVEAPSNDAQSNYTQADDTKPEKEESEYRARPLEVDSQITITVSDLDCPPKYRDIFNAAEDGKIATVLDLHHQYDHIMPLAPYRDKPLIEVTPLVVLCQKIDLNHSAKIKNASKPVVEISRKVKQNQEAQFIETFKKLIDFYEEQGIKAGIDYLNMGGEKSILKWFNTTSWCKNDTCFRAIRNYLNKKRVPENDPTSNCLAGLFAFFKKKSTAATITRMTSPIENGSATATSSNNSETNKQPSISASVTPENPQKSSPSSSNNQLTI